MSQADRATDVARGARAGAAAWLPTASAFLALGWYLMVLGLPSLLSL